MQAVSETPGLPDVTVYRNSPEPAVEWMRGMVKADHGFRRYLLRSGLVAWDVYDARGDLECLCNDVVFDRLYEEGHAVSVDRHAVAAEGRVAVGDASTCIASAECHAGSNSVDHSNLLVLAKDMITDASPENLRQVHLVESHAYACRVVSLFANVAALSADAQDRYLDRFVALEEGLPLSARHHATLMASRTAQLRPTWLADVVAYAMREAGLPEWRSLNAMVQIMTATVKSRANLAAAVISPLLGGLFIPYPGAWEQFDPCVVRAATPTIVSAYAEMEALAAAVTS